MPSTEKPNDEKLSAACGAATEKFQAKISQLKERYVRNPEAAEVFAEIDGFFSPLFSGLVESMKIAPTAADQKELVLQMMRSSFNEQMMVSGRSEIAQVANDYIDDMCTAHTALVRATQGPHAQRARVEDPGGTVQAVFDYMHCLNKVTDDIGLPPAAEIRAQEHISAGPVSAEQRAHLQTASEKILRGLGAPFIDEDMPFQPDMLGVVTTLLVQPDHLQNLIQSSPTAREPLPRATMQKWERLQRDYPDMATNVSSLIDATRAARGHGRSTVQ